jgi:ATP/ADP translocase
MRDLVRTFRGLRHGDLPLTILLSGTYALTLFGVYLLKPARDSLFLSTFSSDDLPLAFILTAVVAIPVSLVYGRASRRWGLGTLFAGSFVFLVLGLVVWRFLLASPSVAASYLFYAFAGIAGGLVASQFWLLGGALCDAQQAKRLFPLLSLGGIAGAALGGWAASRLARSAGFGSLDLILLCAGVWTVALALAILALKQRRPDPTPSRRRRDQERPNRLLWR